MTKKNSENLIQKESIPLIISKENFEIFLNYLLNTLMNEDDKISKDSFYKLFPKFPYFAKKNYLNSSFVNVIKKIVVIIYL